MHPVLLRRYRLILGVFIVGLVLSGITAFPLALELQWLANGLGVAEFTLEAAPHSLARWVLVVRDGLRETYAAHPWIAYGTDWLAFAHVVLAVFFIGPWRDPIRNVWVLQAGLIACVLVIPLAMICGPLRGIPVYWRLIDCSFGILGAVPLVWCLRLVRRMEYLSRLSA